jgi:hypothetical protein
MWKCLTRLTPGLALVVLGLAGAAVAEPAAEWRPLQIDGHAVRWQRPAGSVDRLTLTWRIVDRDEAYPDAVNCRRLTTLTPLLARSMLSVEAFREQLAAAFRMWEQAADIAFVEAAPDVRADISIGAQVESIGRAFADVAYDAAGTGPERAITRSLVCLNPRVGWKIGFDGNLDVYDLRHTLAHEIGHAIGLDHPRARDSLMWFRYDERSAGLQRGDIAGAVALYGPAFRLRPVGDAKPVGDAVVHLGRP